MSLHEMARQFPDMSVTIRLGDLLEANRALVREVRKEVEAEVAEREKVAGGRLVPKDDFQKMVGVNSSTLYRWAKAGYLRPVKFGTKVFYLEQDIVAIIEAHTEKDEE